MDNKTNKYFDHVFHIYYGSKEHLNQEFYSILVEKHFENEKRDVKNVLLTSGFLDKAAPDYFEGFAPIKGLDFLLYRIAKQVAHNRFEVVNDKIILHSDPLTKWSSKSLQNGPIASWLTYYSNQFPMLAISNEEYPSEIKKLIDAQLDDAISDYTLALKEEEYDNDKSKNNEEQQS